MINLFHFIFTLLHCISDYLIEINLEKEKYFT